MSEKLKVFLVRLTPAVDAPTSFLDGADEIPDYFAEGSGSRLEFQPDITRLVDPVDLGTTEHESLELHRVVRNITKNAPGNKALDRVAVLFGGVYKPFPGLFGIMFDRGFATADDPHDPKDLPKLLGRPREGCAVFLDAIRASRMDSELQYQRQIIFTTIHEIGHLFNLEHLPKPTNFMTPSDRKTTYPLNFFRFDDVHKPLLTNATPDKSKTWPGGSVFGDKSVEGSHDSVGWRELGVQRFGLELRVDMARRSFHFFEPVELDIELRIVPGVDQRIRVPDCLDPGYDQFRIWIEEPSGERRLYRSPRIYCWQGGSRVIAPERGLKRDISLFGEAGGYTFRTAGIHRVWAEMAVGRQKRVRSNRIELEIRTFDADDRRLAETAALFGSFGGRVLLYHRQDCAEASPIKAFEDYLEAEPKAEAAGAARYALARAYTRAARARSLEDSRALLDAARGHFEHAVGDRYLGHHQREISLHQLARTSRPRRRSSASR